MNQAKYDAGMKLALETIKKHEGFRVNAYKDVVGIVTIGYGFTSAVLPALKMGDTITKEKADSLLESVVKSKYAAPIVSAVKVWDDVGFTPNMFATLVSLAFNLGPAVAKHDIIKRINEKNYLEAGKLITQKAYTTAGGNVVSGLVKRRAEEALLFLKGYAKPVGIGLGAVAVLALVGWYMWKMSKKSGGKLSYA
jgi:lysozyme